MGSDIVLFRSHFISFGRSPSTRSSFAPRKALRCLRARSYSPSDSLLLAPSFPSLPPPPLPFPRPSLPSSAATMGWTPPPSQASYYSTPAPSDTLPLTSQLLPFRSPPNNDPTYGRGGLPRLPEEERIRKEYGCRDGQVHTGRREDEWVAYQVWEPKKGVESKGVLRPPFRCIRGSVGLS